MGKHIRPQPMAIAVVALIVAFFVIAGLHQAEGECGAETNSLASLFTAMCR